MILEVFHGRAGGISCRLLGLRCVRGLVRYCRRFSGGCIFILGLPGRIAIARKHPEADAVSLMGWVGFLAVVPWIQALIWAFKPTDVVDLRRLPKEEQRETDAMIARLTGKAPPVAADPGKPPSESPAS